MNVTNMTGGLVTELIGGPLDGAEINLDEDLCSPDLDYISIATPESDLLIRYKVRVWRGMRLALVFDGYEEDDVPDIIFRNLFDL